MQKTAYEMRISDWSSDVCSSDRLEGVTAPFTVLVLGQSVDGLRVSVGDGHVRLEVGHGLFAPVSHCPDQIAPDFLLALRAGGYPLVQGGFCLEPCGGVPDAVEARSEEHTYELQSIMRTSYAVSC